jgi:hypothetical protein
MVSKYNVYQFLVTAGEFVAGVTAVDAPNFIQPGVHSPGAAVRPTMPVS